MFDEDLSDFFDTSEFATTFQKVVAGLPVLPAFPAIFSQVDEEVLQGYMVGTVRELRYASAAATLLEGDRITDGTTTWRVLREGRLVNDGLESVAFLTTV